jgi:flagellar assembly protein FliH
VESLIRAPLAGMRVRLSQVRSHAADALETRAADEQSLRRELETQVREQLAQQWQAERAAEFERARGEGLEAARQEIESAVAEESLRIREELAAKLSRTCDALAQSQRVLLEEFSSNLGALAFAVACRLVGEAGRSPEFIRGLVEKACGELRGDFRATVRLHPQDLAILEQHGALPLADGTCQLEYRADASLELGGCTVEATSGRYDGSLETQLRRLHETLVRVDPGAPQP